MYLVTPSPQKKLHSKRNSSTFFILLLLQVYSQQLANKKVIIISYIMTLKFKYYYYLAQSICLPNSFENLQLQVQAVHILWSVARAYLQQHGSNPQFMYIYMSFKNPIIIIS